MYKGTYLMKKILILITVFLSVTVLFACGNTSDNKNVEAIFVGIDKQPSGGRDDLIDTVWIYYDDNTFEQYAEVDDELVFFSQGVYHFEDDGGFVVGLTNPDKDQLVLNRNKKYQYGQGVVDYSSLHTYDLYSLGFDPIYLAREGEPKLVAFLAGDSKQFYKNNGKTQRIDTLWLFFENGTFTQYSEIDKVMEKFSTGTYAFSNGGRFTSDVKKQKYGQITINRETLYEEKKGLIEYKSSHTYELNSIGLEYIWAQK